MGDKKFFPRKIAIVLFYDKNFNILVQVRNSHSKIGEKYGFFGGGIEEGETAEQALRRELIEELNYKPKKLSYFGDYYFILDKNNLTFNGDLFFSPITNDLLNSKPEDDTKMILLAIDEILENKDKNFGPVTFNNVDKIKNFLKSLN